jgi:hypothetical protein
MVRRLPSGIVSANAEQPIVTAPVPYSNTPEAQPQPIVSNNGIVHHSSGSLPSRFDFSIALTHLKEGKAVNRSGWNGANMRVFMVPGYTTTDPNEVGKYLSVGPQFMMRASDGGIYAWTVSSADLFAEDWQIVS